jgi:hypothetical protein
LIIFEPINQTVGFNLYKLKSEISIPAHQDVLKGFILWSVSLLSIKFYTLFVSYSVGKGLVLLAAILVLFFYVINLVYNNSKDYRKEFGLPVVLLLLSLFTSSIAADYFHNQGVIMTLTSEFDLYLFLFYFLLHKIKPRLENILNMIIVLGLIYCVIYIMQYAIYPKVILSCSILKDRGTVRIFMPGVGFMISAYYILLSKFIDSLKIRYVVQIIPIMIIFFLLGTRQVLGIVGLMTLLMVLFSNKVQTKFVVIFLIALCIIPIFFIFQDIINNMFAVTVKQSANSQSNIRVKAAEFFLFKFNHNPLWMIFGNGIPAGHSGYGIAIERLAKSTGLYLNDIGLIGDFFRYGILYVVVMLFIFIKMAVTKLHSQFSFIKYNAITDILSLFTGAGMQSQFIIILCFSMYINDVDKKEIAIEKASDKKPGS